MALDFTWLSTSLFRKELQSLKKDYPSCESDICTEFKGLSFDDVFSKNYTLSNSGTAKVIKVRIANSAANKGKSSGFRLLIVAHSERNHVVLIAVFSKTGAQGKSNIEKEATKKAIATYQIEFKSSSLVMFSLN